MLDSLNYIPQPTATNGELASHFTDLAPPLNARQAAIVILAVMTVFVLSSAIAITRRVHLLGAILEGIARLPLVRRRLRPNMTDVHHVGISARSTDQEPSVSGREDQVETSALRRRLRSCAGNRRSCRMERSSRAARDGQLNYPIRLVAAAHGRRTPPSPPGRLRHPRQRSSRPDARSARPAGGRGHSGRGCGAHA